MADGTAKVDEAKIAPVLDGTNEQRAKLLGAMVRAQKAAHGVVKDAQNTFHRYRYASSEQIIIETKSCLTANGLGVVPVAATLEERGTRLEGDPKAPREVPQLFMCRSWLIVHEDGGSMLCAQTPWPIVPEKGRPLDKATGSTDTTSLGYFLRDLLQLPRVDEADDMDHPRRDEHQGGNVRARQHHDDAPPDDYGPPSQERTTAQAEQITRLLDSLNVSGPQARGSLVAEIVGHEDRLTYDDAVKVIGELQRRASAKPAPATKPAATKPKTERECLDAITAHLKELGRHGEDIRAAVGKTLGMQGVPAKPTLADLREAESMLAVEVERQNTIPH